MLKFQDENVWITGLGSTTIADDQWKDILRIYTDEAFARRINQPVAGTYTRYGDSLSFKPNFPFAQGESYHAIFGKLELSFSIPLKRSTPTVTEEVHPQASTLPENMLRLYISFSQPMMPGEAYDHIKLLTENGTPIDKAFLVIDQELWDAERKRFTLLFDPGRVKRGIRSNVELGSPLQSGQTYHLVIDSAWRDANGNPLSSSYTKTFSVSSAERTRLDTNRWKVIAPDAGTHDDLIIKFDRPIDYALALKCISISAAQAGKIKGKAILINSKCWRFTPDQPWAEDQFYIEIHPQLEDVAGNNFNNPFDIDLSKESRQNSSETLKLPFSVGHLPK
ncbi:MAG TPA: Ig-like domain-containing protein [Cyclobacteriaceae bacterium]|nr:Ig-like domain-containing protein [Cyclobacteriaceae bacterium]